MQIWVDADACPRVIKEILFRAADRKKVQLTLVANQPMHTPASPYINSMVVGSGFDVADDKIVELLNPGDLVITADIPQSRQHLNRMGGKWKLINPHDPADMANAMIEQLRTPTINSQASEAIKSYTWKAFGDEIKVIIEEISCPLQKSA